MAVSELLQKFSEVLTRELPLERLARCLPVILKIEQALSNGIEVREIVWGEDLALDNGDRKEDAARARAEFVRLEKQK